MRNNGCVNNKHFKYKLEKLNEENEVVEFKYYCSINEICKDFNNLNRDTVSRYVNNIVKKGNRLHLKDYNLFKLSTPILAIKTVKIEY